MNCQFKELFFNLITFSNRSSAILRPSFNFKHHSLIFSSYPPIQTLLISKNNQTRVKILVSLIIRQNVFFLIRILICSLILSVRLLTRKKDFKETLSYECGFERYKINRLPFSLNFFILTIIFVLFDLEIILLVAIIPSVVGLQINVFVLGNLFLSLILIGLVLEWYLNKLNWIF